MATQGSLGQLTVDLVANTAGFERGMTQAERALQSATKEAKRQGDALDRLIGQIDPTVAAYSRLDKMQQQLDGHFKAGRLPTEDYKAYTAQINSTREAVGKADKALSQSGVSAKQTAAAFGQLPAQLSDIAVQLAGGQNPFLILLQQGSQIKDSFGGIGPTFDAFGAKLKGLFGAGAAAAGLNDLAAGTLALGEGAEAAGEGLGNMAEGANTAADASKNAAEAADALKTATSGAGIGFGLIVAGVVAAAAALAALIVAYKQGSDESSAYTKALILTGNTAGTSASQLGEIARRVSEVNGTVHEAAATLALLAGSTKIPVQSFQAIATAAANMEDATGKAAQETVSEFAKIAQDPVSAILKLNESMNFLTADVYKQIKALQEQGSTQAAAAIATNAYADAINTRSAGITENLGYLELAWKKMGDAAKATWDAALNIGREDTLNEQLKALDDQLNQIANAKRLNQSDGFSNLTPNDDFRTQALEAQKTQLLVQKAEEDRRAAAKGFAQQQQQQALQDQLQIDKLRKETQSNADKREKEIGEYRLLVERRVASAKATGDKSLVISAEEQARQIAAINEKYKDPKTPKGPRYREDAGQRMLDTLRQQNAALQVQSDSIDQQTGKYKTLGAQAKALAEFEQQIADIKLKDVLTADQKSLLASEELLRAQLKRNVALGQEIAARKTAYEDEQKLAAFRENQASKLSTAQEGLNSQLAGLGMGEKARERLKEDLQIRKEYQAEVDRLNKQFNSGDISQELYDQETAIIEENLAARLVMQQDYYNQVDEAQSSFFLGASEAWANWAEEAQNYSAQAQEFVTGTLDTLSDGLADSFMSILDGTKSVGEAFADLGKQMVASIVGALVKMAAQWLVYQAVQLVAGKAAQAAAVPALVANATATSLQAQLAAFASTAAIPIVGPFLAPGAAAAAAAATAPFVAGIGAAALAGMAHDGIDAVPETGTWLLQKGERVTTASTSAKLDKTLDDVSKGTNGRGGNVTVNQIQDRSRAGQVEETEDDQGERVINLFVADLLGDGRSAEAIGRKYGLRSQGQ